MASEMEIITGLWLGNDYYHSLHKINTVYSNLAESKPQQTVQMSLHHIHTLNVNNKKTKEHTEATAEN